MERHLHQIVRYALLIVWGFLGTPSLGQEAPELDAQELARRQVIVDEIDGIHERKGPRAAISRLEALASAGVLWPAAYERIGSLYIDIGDEEIAERWIRRAVDEAKPVDGGPERFRLTLGKCLWRQKKFAEAQCALEGASRYDKFNFADGQVYAPLGVAYLSVGNNRQAFFALASAIAIDPADARVWEFLHDPPLESPSKLYSPTDDDPLQPPAWTAFEPVLRSGSPALWTPREMKEGLKAYVAYAAALDGLGLPDIAVRYREIAETLPLSRALTAIRRNDLQEAIELYAVADQVKPIDELETNIRATIYQDLVHAYGSKGLLPQAIATAERLFDLCKPVNGQVPCKLGGIAPPLYESNHAPTQQNERWDPMLEVNLKYLSKLIERTFYYVSWDPATRGPRTSRPEEFLGNKMDVHATDAAHSTTTRPYGIVSREEDRVVFLTSMAIERDSFEKSFADARRLQHWEFVVKAMAISVANSLSFGTLPRSELETSGELFGVSIEDVSRAIAESPEASVAPTTKAALDALREELTLIRRIREWYEGTPDQ